MQKWFRSGDALADANCDAALDGRLRLGFSEDRLAVCASHARLKHPGVETPLRQALDFSGPIRNLKAFALDCAYRGRGGAFADQAMADVLHDIWERESYAPTLVISRIDRRNVASEKFAARNDFSLIDDLPQPDQLRNWFTVLEEDEEAAEVPPN
ncbi:hypothetical protein [Streptomyces chrestomyceticus]|uniref:hypothetical protein n=1 Tax=Streptomyces chrestomyceticus TaxID=68185 RepID=UPI0033D6ABB4